MIIVLELPADARRDGISVNKIGRVTPMPNAAILLEERHTLYVSDETIDRLIPLLEPAMMVILGGLIAVLLLAMYLPLFQKGSVFG